MIGRESSGRCVQRVRNSKSHPFKDDDKLSAALQHLSNLLDFLEGLGCHIYVEKAHYEPNNGFAGKFKLERKMDMCPGCLGSPGEQLAVDRQKIWSVRIYDACKRDSPGGLSLVYQGQAPRKRAAAADPTDDDEQPYVSTSQLIPGFGIISRHPSSRLGTHTRPTDEVISPKICICSPLPP